MIVAHWWALWKM